MSETKTIGQLLYEDYAEQYPVAGWDQQTKNGQLFWHDLALAVLIRDTTPRGLNTIKPSTTSDNDALALLIEESFETARTKGWWEEAEVSYNVNSGVSSLDNDKVIAQIGNKCMVIAGELCGEAFEEVRKSGFDPGTIYWKGVEAEYSYQECDVAAARKPEGFLAELADVVIDIFDLIGALGMTDRFIQALRWKMAYNKTRPYRHGGKRA